MPDQKTAAEGVAIYTPENLHRLISIMWNSKEEPKTQSVLMYVVLGAFAGLRPAEATALEWKHIDLAAQTIALAPPVAKLARVVPLKSNLIDFLNPFKDRNGLVVAHQKVANGLRNQCIEAKVTHISNGLRRSYASYRLAEVPDATVRAELGLDATAQNEWKIATPAEAAKYWAIVP
jgi:integrase